MWAIAYDSLMPTDRGSPLLVCLLLPLLIGPLAGCNYLGDRGLDFLDQFNASVGLGTTVGVRGEYLGLVDTGIMAGVKPKATAFGWKYGEMLHLNSKDKRVDADQSQIVWNAHLLDMDYGKGTYTSATNSVAVLPFLLTWGDGTPDGFDWLVPEEGEDVEDRYWLWSSEGFEANRWAQIHAFDIEVGAAIGLWADLGYSPGEFADFLLGILTIDIARDDGRLGSDN